MTFFLILRQKAAIYFLFLFLSYKFNLNSGMRSSSAKKAKFNHDLGLVFCIWVLDILEEENPQSGRGQGSPRLLCVSLFCLCPVRNTALYPLFSSSSTCLSLGSTQERKGGKRGPAYTQSLASLL